MSPSPTPIPSVRVQQLALRRAAKPLNFGCTTTLQMRLMSYKRVFRWLAGHGLPWMRTARLADTIFYGVEPAKLGRFILNVHWRLNGYMSAEMRCREADVSLSTLVFWERRLDVAVRKQIGKRRNTHRSFLDSY